MAVNVLAAIDGKEPTRPSRLAWLLKERMPPPIYWRCMLNGHDWLSAPQPIERVKA